MTLPAIGPSDVVTIGTYLALLLLPGGVLAALCGLRGLTLVAAAPLFTYAVAGLAGPLYSELGWVWTPWTALATFAGVIAVAGVVRFVRGAPTPMPLPAWSRTAWLGVAASVAVAAGVGFAAVLGGVRELDSIPQDWDAVFHANGIRFIATTGDGGLYAMATMNWYENGLTVFYPNAYHLVATLVYSLTGASVPAVLNTHTLFIPGMLAVSMAALVRRFEGRALLAALTALACVSVTSFYDLLWRGPLLPFATGVALTPVLVVLCIDLLDATNARLRAGACFVIAMVGLLCLHPAILIGGILFTMPAIIQRWIGGWRAIPRDFGRLVAAGAVAAGLGILQLQGSLSSAGNLEVIIWPADLTVPEALQALFLFGHATDVVTPEYSYQLRLTALLALGLLCWPWLGKLRWVAATSTIFSALFVIAAASEEPWAKQLTSLWWNDRWRLIALSVVPMCVLMAHGVAQVQQWLVTVAQRRFGGHQVVALGAALAAIVALTGLTRGLYLDRDAHRMGGNTGNGPTVSRLEITGMQAVAHLVPPGQRVLNDRGDGSAWMYALTGVEPVAAHFDAHRTGPDAQLLARRFNMYATDPEVRAAVERLRVHFVQVDKGFLREYAVREPGLRRLDSLPFLQLLYSNRDMKFYRIVEPVVPVDDAQADGRALGRQPVGAGR